jgi:hypothetical protein
LIIAGGCGAEIKVSGRHPWGICSECESTGDWIFESQEVSSVYQEMVRLEE